MGHCNPQDIRGGTPWYMDTSIPRSVYDAYEHRRGLVIGTIKMSLRPQDDPELMAWADGLRDD